MVDDEQRLSLAHFRTFVYAHFGDGAAHLRADLHTLPTLDHGGVFTRQRAVSRAECQCLILCSAILLRGILACGQTREAQATDGSPSKQSFHPCHNLFIEIGGKVTGQQARDSRLNPAVIGIESGVTFFLL